MNPDGVTERAAVKQNLSSDQIGISQGSNVLEQDNEDGAASDDYSQQ
jgi:hypothetical protein